MFALNPRTYKKKNTGQTIKFQKITLLTLHVQKGWGFTKCGNTFLFQKGPTKQIKFRVTHVLGGSKVEVESLGVIPWGSDDYFPTVGGFQRGNGIRIGVAFKNPNPFHNRIPEIQTTNLPLVEPPNSDKNFYNDYKL